MNELFLDECGKSWDDAPTPAFFALGGVALREEDIPGYRAAADAIKVEFFGDTAVTFHEPMMRNHDGRYHFNGNVGRQQEFDAAIAHLIEDTPLVAFGVGVRKAAVRPYFEAAGLDPYLPTDAYALAIIMILERYVDYLAHAPERRMGRVTLESQGPKEDVFHQLEYARALWEGSQWVSASSFQAWLQPGLRFTTKRGSHPAELADIFARDLYEWIRGGCTGSPKHWERFSSKVYRRGDGSMGKFGVKIFPDSDVREHVEAHRGLCRAADA